MTQEKKSGFVTLLGRPNVGKSTLMNALIGQKIAITSAKAQTTRNRIETVYTDERGQIVFLDTPGVHKAKNKLGDFMVDAARSTLDEVDLILWLAEPSAYFGEGEALVRDMLAKRKTPVALIINKADTVGEEAVAACRARFEQEYDFCEVLAVSALKETGLDALMDLIFRHLPEGPYYYDPEEVTTETMRDIAAEIIREKALRNLSEEIPHGIAVTIEQMKEREDGGFDIEASLICEKESHKGIVIGKGASMIKKIGTQARLDIEEMTESPVNLKLFVKERKDWRNDARQVRSFGYKKK